MSNAVPTVYNWIIADVIQKTGDHFASLGVHDQVLKDLERIWNSKIVAANVANFTSTSTEQVVAQKPAAAAPQPVHPSPGPAHPAASSSTLPGVGSLHPSGWGNAGGDGGDGASLEYKSVVAPGAGRVPAGSGGGMFFNGLNGGYSLPQTDGADDLEGISTKHVDERLVRKWEKAEAGRRKAGVAQLDGNDDEDDDEEDGDDNNEDNIDSDLDDPDGDDEEQVVDHMILCQYEKVSRIKNKWKCVLRDGIAHINGRDYLFNKATGEFEW